jgi:hypothetical protein
MKRAILFCPLILVLFVAFGHASTFDPRFAFPASWKENDPIASIHPTNRKEIISWFRTMMAESGLTPYWTVAYVRFDLTENIAYKDHPRWIDEFQVVVRFEDGSLWLWTGNLSTRTRFSFIPL